MLKEALKIGISVVKNTHTYTFDGRIHRQEWGGSIGLRVNWKHYLGVYALVGPNPQVMISRIWDTSEADETVC